MSDETTPKPTTFVLYHGPNCPDGYGAAWTASLALGRGPDVAYVPVNYGDPYPAALDDGVDRLFILDFSYSKPVLEHLATKAREIVVLDHHKSAAQELAGLPYAEFDMDKSGAMLTWEWFHSGEPAPMLVRYVQDRDLWRHELPDTREFSAALAVESRTFDRWDEIATYVDEDGIRSRHYYPFINRGSAILAAQSQHVESLASRAGFRVIAGHRVPAVNSPLFQSEIGHRLCELHPTAPFAAVWSHMEWTGEEVWSLRSRGDFDVTEVARSLGGGGHAAASGFRVARDMTPERAGGPTA